MVKGVNKTVIVVNDTGNKLFEKIVFYVADEYGNLNPKHLRRAATSYKYEFLPNNKKTSLRKKYKKRKLGLLILSAIGVLLTAATGLIIILWIYY